MTDNEKLARFITSLGKFNDYGNTVAQTREALEQNSSLPLRQDNDFNPSRRPEVQSLHG